MAGFGVLKLDFQKQSDIPELLFEFDLMSENNSAFNKGSICIRCHL